jgi:hypothetical protein
MARHRLLKAIGWTCLTGLAVTAAVFLSVLVLGVPSHRWTARVLVGCALLFALIPPFVMEWDLNTRTTSPSEKRPWREQLLWGASGIPVSFFYLLRKDRRVG